MVKDINKSDKTEENIEAIIVSASNDLKSFLSQETAIQKNTYHNTTGCIIDEIRRIQSNLPSDKVHVYFWLGFFMAMTLSLTAILCLNLI